MWALTVGTAWLSALTGKHPPSAEGSRFLQANGDGDRLQSRHCCADILAGRQSPLPPLLSPRRHHTYTQPYTIIRSQGGGAGAEAETRVIYSHSAAQLWPAALQLQAVVRGSPAVSHKEPLPYTRAQRNTNKAKDRCFVHPPMMG